MRTVGIIPARAGSKRLPGKNLALLGGLPLIAHTCVAARASGVLDAIYVNTDSPEIAAAGRQFGVECPVLRPAHLAADTTPTRDSNLFLLDWLARERGEHYDTLVLLQPTSPLRTADDIRAGLALYRRSAPCAVIGVLPLVPHGWLGRVAPDGRFERWTGDDVAHRINGALYIHDLSDYVADRPPPRTLAYVMPAARSVDIDRREDLDQAARLLHASRADPRPGVRIGERAIGDDAPALIIAEAGVNHDGDVERALRLIDVAAEAGADVVKFQMFRAAELVTAGAAAAQYQQAGGATAQRDLLARLELSMADFARLAAHCRARQIEFLVTPFSPADVDRLVELGVRALKIASPDLANPPLLQRAAATGLPLIVSTGAATPEEIERAVTRLRSWGVADRLVLLHCVSGYPAPLAAANLRAIGALRALAGVPCGFSDHTESTSIAGAAIAAGACVLEKHFTLDRRAAGPDHAMSLDPAGLAAYVRAAREMEMLLGSGRLGMTALEQDVRSVARKSVVAARPIAAGVVITADMLTIKRPGGGISPEELELVPGRTAQADIAADTVLTWEHLR
jgi:N,N'-diacetyllegionaminate synthase